MGTQLLQGLYDVGFVPCIFSEDSEGGVASLLNNDGSDQLVVFLSRINQVAFAESINVIGRVVDEVGGFAFLDAPQGLGGDGRITVSILLQDEGDLVKDVLVMLLDVHGVCPLEPVRQW